MPRFPASMRMRVRSSSRFAGSGHAAEAVDELVAQLVDFLRGGGCGQTSVGVYTLIFFLDIIIGDSCGIAAVAIAGGQLQKIKFHFHVNGGGQGFALFGGHSASEQLAV